MPMTLEEAAAYYEMNEPRGEYALVRRLFFFFFFASISLIFLLPLILYIIIPYSGQFYHIFADIVKKLRKNA